MMLYLHPVDEGGARVFGTWEDRDTALENHIKDLAGLGEGGVSGGDAGHPW